MNTRGEEKSSVPVKSGIIVVGFNPENTQWMVLGAQSNGRFAKNMWVETLAKGEVEEGQNIEQAGFEELYQETGFSLYDTPTERCPATVANVIGSSLVEGKYFGSNKKVMPLHMRAVLVDNINDCAKVRLKNAEYNHESPAAFARELGAPEEAVFISLFYRQLEKGARDAQMDGPSLEEFQNFLTNVSQATTLLELSDIFVTNKKFDKNIRAAVKNVNKYLAQHEDTRELFNEWSGALKIDKQVRLSNHMIERAKFVTLEDYLDSIDAMRALPTDSPNYDAIYEGYLDSFCNGKHDPSKNIDVTGGQIHIALRAVAAVAPEALAALPERHQHFLDEAGIDIHLDNSARMSI